MTRKKWLITGCCAAMVLVLFFWVNSPPKNNDAMICPNRMREIAWALLAYEGVHGQYPPPYTVDENGKPLHSWRTLILPFLEQDGLYKKIRLDEPWDSEYNKQFHDIHMPIFCCPSKGEMKTPHSDYDVVVGENTAFPPFNGKERPKVTLKDLTAHGETVLLVERKSPVHWMQPGGIAMEDLVEELDWRHGEKTLTLIVFADRSMMTLFNAIISNVKKQPVEWKEKIKRLCEWKNRTEKDK